jgi:hypothetical protein
MESRLARERDVGTLMIVAQQLSEPIDRPPVDLLPIVPDINEKAVRTKYDTICSPPIAAELAAVSLVMSLVLL